MRRILACLTALALALPTLGISTLGISTLGFPAGARAQGAQPPHAWLFGTWTGGLFPVSSTMTAEACFGQPVVVFTRDVVLRATLTEPTYTQRVIETARTDPGVTNFRFVPGAPGGGKAAGLMGITGPAAPVGFGCEASNVLHVQRRGENEIAFPGCAEFSYPLVRCGGR